MMLNLLITEKNKYLLCIPYFYTFFSRTKSVRDFVVNAATSWMPAIILIFCLAEASFVESVLWFLLGYLLFVSVYEIGYLANDSYGLLNDPTPRDRLKLRPTLPFVMFFVLIRIFCFLLIAFSIDVIGSWFFWLLYILLCFVLVAHNIIDRLEYKFFTFFQLSVFRYSLPVFPALFINDKLNFLSLVMILGIFTFTLPRFLTYLDAKGRLNLPERKNKGFLLFSLLVMIPSLIALTAVFNTFAPLFIFGWLVFVQGVYNMARISW